MILYYSYQFSISIITENWDLGYLKKKLILLLTIYKWSKIQNKRTKYFTCILNILKNPPVGKINIHEIDNKK